VADVDLIEKHPLLSDIAVKIGSNLNHRNGAHHETIRDEPVDQLG
jgi:hypothetical protein